MKCHNVEQAMPLYIGGDLAGFMESRVRQHIEHCDSCRKELAKYQATLNLARASLKRKELSVSHDSLWEQILYRLPRDNRNGSKVVPVKKSRPVYRLVPAVLGAAVIIILLLMGDGGPFRTEFLEPPQPVAARQYPVVEQTDPGVTVMTFQTDDPKVTIVWFFQKEPDQENGGKNET